MSQGTEAPITPTSPEVPEVETEPLRLELWRFKESTTQEIAALRGTLEETAEEAARPLAPRELLRLLRDAADQGLQTASIPEARWHLIVVPDAGAPSKETFATASELAGYLRGIRGEDVRVFPFYGRMCGVTRGGNFLLTHEGRFSLTEIEDLDEVDPAGYIGRPGVELTLPEAAANGHLNGETEGDGEDPEDLYDEEDDET